MNDEKTQEALDILEALIDWGYGQTVPLGEIIGEDLEKRVYQFVVLNGSDETAEKYSDYWESIWSPMPEVVQERMRGLGLPVDGWEVK